MGGIRIPLWNSEILNKKNISVEDISLLNETRVFKGLNTHEMQRVYNLVHNRKYKKNEYIFEEGYPGAALFIVKEGKVNIERGGAKIEELEKGSFAGEIFLVSDMERSCSARCEHDSQMLVLFCEDLMDLVKSEPALGVKVMINISEILTIKLIETTRLLEQKNI